MGGATGTGETLEIGHLFQGFRDQERMGPLVMLGLISVAGYVLITLVLVMFVGGGMMMGAMMDGASTACRARRWADCSLAPASWPC